jgi:hypothetical protein
MTAEATAGAGELGPSSEEVLARTGAVSKRRSEQRRAAKKFISSPPIFLFCAADFTYFNLFLRISIVR